jgi:hypothetical protein
MEKEGVSYSFNTERVVEWLPILLRIWEVPDSNLGLESGYPD